MGLGLLWILYAGWWSGMRVIFILQFLCVMSGIYWHLTRRSTHCAPANLNRQYFFSMVPHWANRHGTMLVIIPLQMICGFASTALRFSAAR